MGPKVFGSGDVILTKDVRVRPGLAQGSSSAITHAHTSHCSTVSAAAPLGCSTELEAQAKTLPRNWVSDSGDPDC